MPMLQTSIDTAAALSDRPRRRRFTVQDKLRILAETDNAAETGGGSARFRAGPLVSARVELRSGRHSASGSQGILFFRKNMPRRFELGGVIKLADIKMNLGRAFTFTCQCGAASRAETA